MIVPLAAPHTVMKPTLLLPLVLATAALAACSPDPASAQAAPPLPRVEFVHPVARDVVDRDVFTGRLQAVATVDVQARVSGYLESIHFEDGAMVAQGQLLFVIDARPFQAVLDGAEAEQQGAQAALELARSNLARGERLLASNAIAAEDVELRRTAVAEASAALAAAEAHVDAARLDLEFTRVEAPIAGRISDHRLSVGNLISGGQQATPLATIVTLDPIDCRIEADERTVLRYMRLNASGRRESSREVATPVEVGLADEDGFPHAGVLDFIDNRLDTGTGTLRARARIPNADHFLTPGMFARVRMSAEGPHPALLVPDEAVQSDQTRQFLLTLGPDDVVAAAAVELGVLTDDGLREIRSGVAAEDRVIVSGLFLARPGARVQASAAQRPPVDGAEAPAPSSASAQ